MKSMPLPRKQTMPKWLGELSYSDIKPDSLPLKRLLTGSLFYPASATDGDPVKYFAGRVHSFVYVDNSTSFQELSEKVNARGFLGYSLLGSTNVSESLIPVSNWESDHIEPLPALPTEGRPYCHWFVFERGLNHGPEHGPERFSLLFINHDGMLAYENLYGLTGITPRMVAIIQPGHGCGGNWTDFTDRREIFAQLMLDKSPKMPRYLLYGGDFACDDYATPCWPEYDEHIQFIQKTDGHGCLSLWQSHHPKV